MPAFHILGPILLSVFAAQAADNPKPPKTPKPPPPPKTQAQPNKANPGKASGAPAPRPIDAQIERLARMSPAEREKALSNLPPERRLRLEAGIAKWNQTPAHLKELNDKFQSLPPETKKRIRQLSQKIGALPPDRQRAVRLELERLRNMPEADREIRLNSPAIQKNFSPNEREILRETPDLLPHNFF